MHVKAMQRKLRIVVMAVLMAAMALLPTLALGKTVLDVYPDDYTPKNPVQDNITRLNVGKLEKGARDGVVGAHMAIFEKETGKLITEWVTDGSVHEVARNAEGEKGALDIDVVYVLRELEAPEGYLKAKDVEFIIHSDDFNTTGEILDGDQDGNAESDEIHGSGPEQAFVINVFDESTVHAEEVERRQRESNDEFEDSTKEETLYTETTESETKKGGGNLTKTGDTTSYVPVIVVAVLGAAFIGFAIYKRRK